MVWSLSDASPTVIWHKDGFRWGSRKKQTSHAKKNKNQFYWHSHLRRRTINPVFTPLDEVAGNAYEKDPQDLSCFI